MKEFIKISVKPLVVAIIATIVVFVDSLIAPLFLAGISFVWISFINWTAFFGASFSERRKSNYRIYSWVCCR